MVIANGKNENADGSDDGCHPLQPSHLLLQNHRTKGDDHEGIDVVTKRRLHHMAVIYRPNKDEPITGDADRCEEESHSDPRLLEQRPSCTELLSRCKNNDGEEEGPDGAVCHDLIGVDALQVRPIQGDKTPDSKTR